MSICVDTGDTGIRIGLGEMEVIMKRRMKTIVALGIMIVLTGLGCCACGEQGSSSDNLEGSLSEIMASLYEKADLEQDFRDVLDSFETYELTDELEVSILGTDQITYQEGVVSMPMMSSMAYQCVLLRVEESDVDTVKQALKDNANPDKWVCVSAETTLIESRGNVIFFIMSDKNIAYAMNSAFQNL